MVAFFNTCWLYAPSQSFAKLKALVEAALRKVKLIYINMPQNFLRQ